MVHIGRGWGSPSVTTRIADETSIAQKLRTEFKKYQADLGAAQLDSCVDGRAHFTLASNNTLTIQFGEHHDDDALKTTIWSEQRIARGQGQHIDVC
ncbi:MAG: hypothetical protein AB7E85_00640 [Pseudobdellovibrionaceae bacterium]